MKNKVICLSFIILFGLTAGICLAKYSGGNGSEANPYRIADAYDMNDIGLHDEDWGSHFVMVNDINLAQFTGTQFNIIGNNINAFAGVFDGNGHTISNFTWKSTGIDAIGVFRYVGSPGEIKNLGLIDPNIDGGTAWCVGSLVGRLRTEGQATVSCCYVDGGSVSGDNTTGGLVGDCWATILCCYTKDCNVSGGEGHTIGGLLGTNRAPGMLDKCYASSSVSGSSDIGGLIGENNGTVTACFWDMQRFGLLNGVGDGSSSGVTGKTTSEMQTESTFSDVGWDFIEIWNIGENQTYPFLRLYPAGDLNHDGRVDGRDLAIIATHWLDGI